MTSARPPVARARHGVGVATVTMVLLASHATISALNAVRDSSASAGMAAAQLLIFIATGIAVLIWTYRACAQVEAAGARHLSATPTMAVAWYFVPVGNLFMPYAALRDVWKASIDPIDWEAIKTPMILKLWWLSWISSNVIGLAVLRLEYEYGARPTLQTWSSISDGLTALCAIFLAAVVFQLKGFQSNAPDAVDRGI